MMDVDKLKDYALLIKNTFRSSKNTPLEIFYHEPNYCKLFSQKEVDSSINIIYTPVYANTDKEVLSFRGFIQTCNIDHLTLGLECSFKTDSLDNIVEWSVSIYNTAKDDCLLLGASKIVLSSGDPMCRSEIKVAISTIETFNQGNPLVFKWCVETLSAQSKDTDDRNEVHGSNIGTSPDVLLLSKDTDDQLEAQCNNINALIQHLSSQVFKEDDQNKQELHSALKEILTCQFKQNDNEGKLQTIEQQCLNINERLGQLLEKINLQELHVSRQIANVSIRSSDLQNTDRKGKLQISDDKVFSPQFDRNSKLKRTKSDIMLYGTNLTSQSASTKSDAGKQSKTCQTQTVEGCLFPVNKVIQSNQTTQTDLESLASNISTHSQEQKSWWRRGLDLFSTLPSFSRKAVPLDDTPEYFCPSKSEDPSEDNYLMSFGRELTTIGDKLTEDMDKPTLRRKEKYPIQKMMN